MTIRWKPDTCSCVIELEHGTLKYENWIQKCPGHADKDGQGLADVIFAHNRSFKISIADQKVKKKRNANVKAKRVEKNRIAKLGAVTKKFPNTDKPSEKGGRG